MKQARATDRTHTNADPIHHRLAICLCVVTREHPSANSIFLPFFLVSLLCEIVVAIMMLAGGRCHEFSIGETDNQRIGGSGIICVSFFFRAKMGKSYLLRVCLFTFRFRSQEFFFSLLGFCRRETRSYTFSPGALPLPLWATGKPFRSHTCTYATISFIS
jgi:hypothetical protein